MKKTFLLLCLISASHHTYCMKESNTHPLLEAVYNAAASSMEFKKSPFQPTDDQGNTALHQLASKKHKEVPKEKNTKIAVKAHILIRHGHDVNAVNNDGETPLHLAARWGNHYFFARRLLENGALVDAQNTKGDTPLLYCWIGIGDSDGKTITPALQKRIDMSKLLIAHGADIYKPSNSGSTPYECAGGLHGISLEAIKKIVEKENEATK